MVDLYYWPTPNGYKISMFLEETDLSYSIVPINIGKGEQFQPEFLKISPNNRIPALVDHAPTNPGQPVSVFESGAILLYLAEKTGRFLSPDIHQRTETLEWLFWQVGGLGPMLGQNHHFSQYAPEKLTYAIERYQKETTRLYTMLNKKLEHRDFIAAEYSIADMACYPWIVPFEKQGQDLAHYPNLKKWFERIQERPATQRAYEKGQLYSNDSVMSEEAKKILFGVKKQ